MNFFQGRVPFMNLINFNLFFRVFLKQPPIPISISRVNQVDAARLDVEISGMLKEQLVKVFNLIKVYFLIY